MKVFKFGGASIKNANGIKNLYEIVSKENSELIIVVSAIGKTTNELEYILRSWYEDDPSYLDFIDNLLRDHFYILDDLKFSPDSDAVGLVYTTIDTLKEDLIETAKENYDLIYDNIVSYGEVLASIIVSEYLKTNSVNLELIDIRDCLKTDNQYRDANIMWKESIIRMHSKFNFLNNKIYVTQGFIACSADGHSTTLGREGSDYSAAVIANMLNAESVTVWKDVPGIMNADPVWMPDAIKLDEISYREAVELTFSGAKVIHPKTIKPLHNKQIPMFVKSFINPTEPGTVIKSDVVISKVIPVYIKKEEQMLISILPRDFSFVMGENLSRIFNKFMQHGIKVNLVEASAVSLDVCVDYNKQRVESLLADMKLEFAVVYNDNVELLTVRHHNPLAVNKITEGREILIEQRTRSTVRFVVRK